MEFWGVEVKAGEPLKVKPDDGMVLHLSQASLGESKKASEAVVVSLKVDDKKLVLGTLSHDKFPQLSFDVVFEKEFELSHNWKNGSVYFIGYKTTLNEDEGFSDEFESDEEPQLIPVGAENGKREKKGEPATAKANASKPDAKPKVESGKDEDEDSDEGGSEDSEEEDESDSDEEMKDDSDEESDESEEEEEEETPKKVESSKKRPADSATKTPVSNKKAKADGKKGSVHVATPHPAKQTGKTPAPAQTPKSGGQFTCGSCKKSFNSEMGLQSHNKAKHSGPGK